MCNIAFFRKTEKGEKRYLEITTDYYFIDYGTKKMGFHRPWNNDWAEEKYESIETIFEKGFIYIKVVN